LDTVQNPGQAETILSSLSAKFSGLIIVPNTSPACIQTPAETVVALMSELRNNPSSYFDQLSCVTGIDNGPAAGTMEVVYHLYSIPFNQSLAIKVILPRDKPEVASLSGLWKSANWLEREVFDMFGITFSGHPDLRRILMPADWEGFPLRKDYQHQELYRDVKVKY
jgi:NADH-quinone oxidoreductase subunit C